MSADLFAAFGSSNTSSSSPGSSTSQPHCQQSSSLSSCTKPGGQRDHRTNPEVLFDAEEYKSEDETEDEWGDFESANQSLPRIEKGPISPQQDLLDGAEETSFSTSPTLTLQNLRPQPLLDLFSTDIESPETKLARISDHLTGQSRTRQHAIPNETWSSISDGKEDEGWGEFIDGEDKSSATNVHQPTSTDTDIASGRAPSSLSSPSQVTPTGVLSAQKTHEAVEPRIFRPTNIPPPSILLTLFPPLLQQFNLIAGAAVKGKGSKTMDREFITKLTWVLKSMVHVIAGRQLRWKRDHLLSQSTRIGPARPGNSMGMKLSSLNKSENVKEEQEVVEVLEAWKKYSAFLNSVGLSNGMVPIPSLSTNIPVRAARLEEGAQRAAHVCALCGLKRDERVPKVDDNINDSFGEWWAEHWGHSDCQTFWESTKQLLGQR